MSKKSNKKHYTLREILSRIFFIGVISWIIILSIYNTIYVPYLLRNFPTCILAAIEDDYYSGRYLGRRISYSFIYNNSLYTGSLKKSEVSKKWSNGDSICVVFFEKIPQINRPLSSFDTGAINCNCK
jgi:hypothetical protein